jgi:hypothetical protein
MSPEQLQSAADHIRMGNYDYNPDQYATLTVTEGMQNGHPVYTVTSSRGRLKPREQAPVRRNLRMAWVHHAAK